MKENHIQLRECTYNICFLIAVGRRNFRQRRQDVYDAHAIIIPRLFPAAGHRFRSTLFHACYANSHFSS